MYAGLINQFANGTFNRAIVDHTYTYPDVVPLIHVKIAGPTDIKVSPVQSLRNLIQSNEQRADLDAIKRLILEIVEHGTEAGQSNEAKSKALIPSAGAKLYQNITYIANNSAPRIVLVYLRYILAHVIHDLISANTNTAQALAVYAAGLPGPAVNLAAYQLAYGATLESVIARVLALPENTAIANFAIVFAHAGIGGQDGMTIGAPAPITAAGGLSADTTALINAFNRVLRHSSANGNNDWGSINFTAANSITYDNMTGVNSADKDQRADLFASLLVAIALELAPTYATLNAQRAAADGALTARINAVKDKAARIPTAFVPGRADPVSSTVKYDDLLATDKDSPSESSITVSAAGALLFARSDAISGVANNSIKLPSFDNKKSHPAGSDSLNEISQSSTVGGSE